MVPWTPLGHDRMAATVLVLGPVPLLVHYMVVLSSCRYCGKSTGCPGVVGVVVVSCWRKYRVHHGQLV